MTSGGRASRGAAQTSRIALAAGGTGGHLFAAVGMARALIRRGLQTALVISEEERSRRFLTMEPEAAGIPIEFFKWGRLGRALGLGTAFFRCRAILRRLRPEAVIAPGGYAAVPAGLAAWWLGIPLVLHEENAVLGRANRLLAPFASRKLAAMPVNGRDDFEAVGLPLRERLLSVKRKAVGRPVIFVMGGSQGAKALDEAVMSLYTRLAERKPQPALIHIAGPHAIDKARDAFAKAFGDAPDWAGVFPFRQDMEKIYERATVAVTRAGALTVAELSYFALPAVLVPYPHAGYHQLENAEALKRPNPAGVRVVEQETDFVERLRKAIEDLLGHEAAADRGGVADKAPRIGNDGEQFVAAIEEIIRG